MTASIPWLAVSYRHRDIRIEPEGYNNDKKQVYPST